MDGTQGESFLIHMAALTAATAMVMVQRLMKKEPPNPL